MLMTCKIKVHVFEKKIHRVSQRAPPPTKNYTRFMDRFTVSLRNLICVFTYLIMNNLRNWIKTTVKLGMQLVFMDG